MNRSFYLHMMLFTVGLRVSNGKRSFIDSNKSISSSRNFIEFLHTLDFLYDLFYHVAFFVIVHNGLTKFHGRLKEKPYQTAK